MKKDYICIRCRGAGFFDYGDNGAPLWCSKCHGKKFISIEVPMNCHFYTARIQDGHKITKFIADDPEEMRRSLDDFHHSVGLVVNKVLSALAANQYIVLNENDTIETKINGLVMGSFKLESNIVVTLAHHYLPQTMATGIVCGIKPKATFGE